MLKFDIMKKFVLPLVLTVLFCSSCSQLFYQQIATLSSDNVTLRDNGDYAYEDGMMTIEYDFWAESGKFTFIVTNNSDEDIYLNMAESYFINNGYAQDYYQARTYLSVEGTSLNTNGKSIEFTEKAVVCIPAHSYKTFTEFSIATSVFRECGFVRDPSKKETAVREYTKETSPQVIENRLMFNIGNITLPVTNVFYVSQYQNISTDAATEWIKVEGCDGYKTPVRVHKLSASNKFYITYGREDLFPANGSGSNTDRR